MNGCLPLKLWENFGKTRFRRSPTFYFSTLKTSKNIEFLQNLERPFTPRGWLRLASNFGKTRFRRPPTFHFSTSKTKKLVKIFDENFRHKETFVAKSTNCLFLRSYGFLDVIGRCALKIIPKVLIFTSLRLLTEG